MLLLTLLIGMLFAGSFIMLKIHSTSAETAHRKDCDRDITQQEETEAVQTETEETGAIQNEAEETVVVQTEVEETETSCQVDFDIQTEKLLEAFSLEEKIAQLFFVTPEALTGVNGVTAAGETTRMAYEMYPVGGIVYFENNIVSLPQWKELACNMLAISEARTGLPVFLAVDEEGGLVTRFSGRGLGGEIPDIPSMALVGSKGDPDYAYKVGRTIGEYLRELFISVDFAPVADVFSNPANTVIGDRAFSSDPYVAAEMTAAMVKGMKESGILCTLKHFPGHGNTEEDSHFGGAFSGTTIDELWQCELLPFAAGIRAGADFVMTGHISLPNVTGSDLPATLSEKIIADLLRDRMEFEGIVITDAMNMGAIIDQYGSGSAAVSALQAGVDMILMPADFQSTYQAVIDAAYSGELSEERIDDSVRRIIRTKLKMLTEADQ